LRLDRRVLVVLAVLTVLQVVVYYDHFAVALSLLFGLGIGLWLRHWSAAVLALASFVIAFAIAAGTGWTEDVRGWELLFGIGLSFLGGLIGGGIFDLLRMDREGGGEMVTE